MKRLCVLVVSLLLLSAFATMAIAEESAIKQPDTKLYYEPSAGLFHGWNFISEWTGAFASLDIWKEKIYKQSGQAKLGSSFGLDLQAFGCAGETKGSDYTWDEISAGGGPAYKYVDISYNKNGKHPYQYVVKLPVMIQLMNGRNKTIGYSNRQTDVLLAPYAEALRKDNGVVWGATAEVKIPIVTSFSSSYSGDKKSDQLQGNLTLLMQEKISPKMQVREYFSPIIYQAWDKMYFARPALELRFREMAMLYVSVAFPYSVSETYKSQGLKREDLITYTIGIRIELGKPLRAITNGNGGGAQ